MRINTNVAAMNTYGRLTSANASKANSLAKLSSGLRINKAGDDAAGLAISEKMKGQIGGMNQAKRNAQDGVSLIQTAEGALNETHSMLGRMRDLAVQAHNGTLTDDDKTQITKEFDQLKAEITRVAKDTEFNTLKLFNGDAATTKKAFTFQIGANDNQTITVSVGGMNAKALGVDTLTAGGANAMSTIDKAISTVSTQRSELGSVQNRLEHTINNLTSSSENLSDANSRIRDVDMAEEMMSFTKSNILSQAATTMLAQANSMPNSVLSLLQG